MSEQAVNLRFCFYTAMMAEIKTEIPTEGERAELQRSSQHFFVCPFRFLDVGYSCYGWTSWR